MLLEPFRYPLPRCVRVGMGVAEKGHRMSPGEFLLEVNRKGVNVKDMAAKK